MSKSNLTYDELLSKYREQCSLLKLFLTHGQLIDNTDGSWTWKFDKDITFYKFEENIPRAILKFMDDIKINSLSNIDYIVKGIKNE